jgi:hypothetical protein
MYGATMYTRKADVMKEIAKAIEICFPHAGPAELKRPNAISPAEQLFHTWNGRRVSSGERPFTDDSHNAETPAVISPPVLRTQLVTIGLELFPTPEQQKMPEPRLYAEEGTSPERIMQRLRRDAARALRLHAPHLHQPQISALERKDAIETIAADAYDNSHFHGSRRNALSRDLLRMMGSIPANYPMPLDFHPEEPTAADIAAGLTNYEWHEMLARRSETKDVKDWWEALPVEKKRRETFFETVEQAANDILSGHNGRIIKGVWLEKLRARGEGFSTDYMNSIGSPNLGKLRDMRDGLSRFFDRPTSRVTRADFLLMMNADMKTIERNMGSLVAIQPETTVRPEPATQELA